VTDFSLSAHAARTIAKNTYFAKPAQERRYTSQSDQESTSWSSFQAVVIHPRL